MHELKIVNLSAEVDGKTILNGISFSVRTGEVHILMGPNGAGKSTLSSVLMGNPKFKITGGDILFDGESILTLTPTERAKKGLFLSFQYPVEVPGVSMFNFLRMSYSRLKYGNNKLVDLIKFKKRLESSLSKLSFDKELLDRYLNVGFSGGEKKRSEIFQMLILKPKIAILDETDSGLDIDALRLVASAVNYVSKKTGILMITHYTRVLQYIKPTHVHVLVNGKILKEGGPSLAAALERRGYSWLKEKDTEMKISNNLVSLEL